MFVEKDTKIDEVAATLLQRIHQGQYVSGQRLPSEREFAEELGVSRVTVRAALLRLQSDNIIDIIPRGGAFVRSSSTKVVIGPPNPSIAKGLEKMTVRMPSSEEASLLNISRSQPVVDMDRWVWAHENTLFEYTHIVANAALHEYTYSYDIDEEASK